MLQDLLLKEALNLKGQYLSWIKIAETALKILA